MSNQRVTWMKGNVVVVLAGLAIALALAIVALASAPNPLILLVMALPLAPAAAVAAMAFAAYRWATRSRRARRAPMPMPAQAFLRAPTAAPPPAMEVATPTTALTAADMGGIDVFRGLTPRQREAIAALGHRERFASGTPLGEANDSGLSVYGILSGQVELFAPSPVGHATIRIAGPGESLPLSALIGAGKLIVSAHVMTDADMAVIPARALKDLCMADPAMGMQVYAAIAAIVAERYRLTLGRLTETMREALRQADFWANV